MPKQNLKDQYATKNDLKGLRTELKGDMKQLRVEMNEDIKTHIGVLYEKFSDDVKLVIESQQDTNRQVTLLGERTSSLEDKMDMVIDTLGEVKVSVNEIKDQLQNKVDRQEHNALAKRVSVLEAKA